MELENQIKDKIKSTPVLLYMKGTPDFPMCGFSARVSHALEALGANFEHVNVLAEPEIRQTLPKVANWPTFPQLYIKGELVGGCDIVMDLYEKGELQSLLA